MSHINGQAKIEKSQFIKIAKTVDNNCSLIEYARRVVAEVKEVTGVQISVSSARKRIRRMREKNLLGSPKINFQENEIIKGRSLYVDEDNNIQRAWIKTDVKKQDQLNALQQAVENIVGSAEGRYQPKPFKKSTNILTSALYVSNDIHVGAMMGKEYNHDRDWDLKIATDVCKQGIDYLINSNPDCDEAVIADLGDLLEIDDYTNSTKRSGNILDVDGRWDKALEVAIDIMVYFCEQALAKHKTVYFYNIDGNHDDTSGVAIRLFIKAYFRNEPRLIVCTDRRNIKYHIFGSTAIPFAHGHELKMGIQAEACFVSDLRAMGVMNDIRYISAHFGHNHKDSVYDGANSRQESHRNLPPSNVWATNMGYRRQVGTMKSIIYHAEFNEISRNTFNINMIENKKG